MQNNANLNQGFTLLEVLVAILIFGIVMTSLFVSFRSLMFEPDGIKQTLSREEIARSALDRMISDLHSIYVALPPLYRPPETNDPPHPHRLVGQVDFAVRQEFSRLRFSSLAHLPMQNTRRQGIAQIVYYVQALEDETYVLRRADHLEPYPPLSELDNDPILCEGVQSLTFQFVDEEGDVHEVWNSDAEEFDRAMPSSIMVRLELKGEENPSIFETQVRLPLQRRVRG